MKNRFIILCLVFWSSLNFGLSQTTPLPNAHAHNDYEHERALLDALENGFTSVEADIYLIDGELYVYHDRPETIDPNRTLEKLYLEPLSKVVEKNNGEVYQGYEGFFHLMIDFKTDGESTYHVLKAQLKKYEDILSRVVNGKREIEKPVLVFISGSRPIETILSEPISLATLDGRPNDLGKGISTEKMPVISQNYWSISNWNGEGAIDETNKKKLREVIDKAHAEGKKVRFWAIPDHINTWKTMMDLGVDFINTDKLSEFKKFSLEDNR